MSNYSFFAFILLIILVPFYYVSMARKPRLTRPSFIHLSDIQDLFPTTQKSLDELVTKTHEQVASSLEDIYAIDPKKRTFDNTLRALDSILEQFKIAKMGVYTLSIVFPDESFRKTAQAAFTKMQSFYVDMFTLNKRLYKAFTEYENLINLSGQEQLCPSQLYFLQKLKKDFAKNGLHLSDEQQEKIKLIQKELAELGASFEATLASSQMSIPVKKDDLKGLEDSFINTLKRSEQGDYILTTDYSIFYKVIEQCEVERIRKKLYRAFMQRGYPENERILSRVIALSDELAHLLGYQSFAHAMLDDQMAKTPERVQHFLEDMHKRVQIKVEKERALITRSLPSGVELHNGKIKPWDFGFLMHYYKKTFCDVDEAYLAEYFPLKFTLPALLDIYKQFFGVYFKEIKGGSFWHKDVQVVAAYKEGTYIGTVLLDLFPRPGKYPHAGQLTIVPTVTLPSGRPLPGVVVVIANFSPEHEERPSLLKRTEVKTFFHEFGHAIHALLGATEFASLSGTATKNDFVEMPSQMLEEWLWDPDILKKISAHYKTEEPLSDDFIKKIIRIKQCDSGDSLSRQVALASVSLAYYMPGAQKDIYELWKSMSKMFPSIIDFDPHSRAYCSFPHLISYGPSYYGYVWSKVFALDLFNTIKPYGLLNKTIGDRYIKEVIGKGGSEDPELFLTRFLGREPSSEAFFQDLEL